MEAYTTPYFSGYNKTLADFSYKDGDIGDLLYDSMFTINFEGMLGRTSFGADGEHISYTKISQRIGEKHGSINMIKRYIASIDRN